MTTHDMTTHDMTTHDMTTSNSDLESVDWVVDERTTLHAAR
ncbi:MAG TPA: hypothetical protein VMM60_09640 [Ilumatobacter sp.]|nr:hypothetical protein [Ilumatobacter sp.]